MSLKIGVDVDGTLTFPSLPKILSTILSVVSFFLPTAKKELISYSFEDVQNIYDEIKTGRKSLFTKFFHFIFNIE